MRVLLVCAVAVVAAGCGGGAGGSEVLELRVTVPAKYRELIGGSHEWYDPRTMRHRVESRVGGVRLVRVYDGKAVVEQRGRKLIRTAGGRRFVAAMARQVSPFDGPGIMAVDARLRNGWGKFLRVRKAGDGAYRVVWHYGTDTGETDVPYTVRVVGRNASDDVFEPPEGELAGELRQVEPGEPPKTDVDAWWFGDKLGPAEAVTALERWGEDPWDWGDRDPPSYTTVYRLPPDAIPPGIHDERGPYPGLGAIGVEIHVKCTPGDRSAVRRSFGSGIRPQSVRLATGRRVPFFGTAGTRSGREQVHAVFVIGRTLCWVDGLVSDEVVRRAATRLRPV
jgi:hypothetical protein